MPQWQFKLLEFTIREQLAIDKDEYIPGKDNRKFIVQMYGLNSEGKTASIFVRGYNPFFYILVGDDWTEQTVMEFQAYLKKELGSYFEDSLKKCKLEKHNKLYGFDNKNLVLRNAYDVFLLSKKTNAKDAFLEFNTLQHPLHCFFASCFEIFNKPQSLTYINSTKTEKYLIQFIYFIF